MPDIDFLQASGSEVITTKHGITRVEGDGASVHFGDENPIELKEAINRAMEQTLNHYKPRNKRTLLHNYLSEDQLIKLVRNIVLHFLYMYSNWRRTIEKYENLRLELNSTDLDSVQSNRECYAFCKRVLGSNFRVTAAALMGISIGELENFEAAEERHANR